MNLSVSLCALTRLCVSILAFQFSVFSTPLFGPWSVKVVNKLDRCSKDAQDMLLTYLDRMKPSHAFLGTTNLDVTSLTKRPQGG
jgi:hypothetical protein